MTQEKNNINNNKPILTENKQQQYHDYILLSYNYTNDIYNN